MFDASPTDALRRARSLTYALINTLDAAIGFESAAPRTKIPYSVSMPSTFRIATTGRYLEVLPGGYPFDGTAARRRLLFVLLDQRAHVHDALALLARDLRPVVGIRGVGQVFVFLELLRDRRDEVRDTDAWRRARDLALDRQLLGTADDVLDHRARREVLEEHDFLVAVLVRHLEEAVAL